MCKEGEVKMVNQGEEKVSTSKKFVFKVDDTMGESNNKYPECEVLCEGHMINMYADSCSPYTLINKKDWKVMSENKDLGPHYDYTAGSPPRSLWGSIRIRGACGGTPHRITS